MDKKTLPWLAAGSMLLASCKDSQVQPSSHATELTTEKRIEIVETIRDYANLYSIVDQKVIEEKVQEMINDWKIPTETDIFYLFQQQSLDDIRLQVSE